MPLMANIIKAIQFETGMRPPVSGSSGIFGSMGNKGLLEVPESEDFPVFVEEQNEEEALGSLEVERSEDTPGSLETEGEEETPGSLEVERSEDTPGSLETEGEEETPGSLETEGEEETSRLLEVSGMNGGAFVTVIKRILSS